jgi:excisionase family DNA binding protein
MIIQYLECLTEREQRLAQYLQALAAYRAAKQREANDVEELAALVEDLRPATEWVTVDQAARLTGLAPRSVRRLAANGDVQAHKEGHTWRVLLSDVEALVAAGEIVPRAREGKKDD